MKTTKQRFVSRTIAGLLLPAMLSLSTVQAADAVQWNDLPKKIGGKMRTDNPDRHQYWVVTKDGQMYAGSALFFGPRSVGFTESGPAILREQVTEIRIHRYGSLLEALFRPAASITEGGGGGEYGFGDPFDLLLLVFAGLTITAVAAPIVLPIEGVKRLLPDRVIKVAP
jgi:hypothetical protein